MMSTVWGLPPVMRWLNEWTRQEYQRRVMDGNFGDHLRKWSTRKRVKFWSILVVMLVPYIAFVWWLYASGDNLKYLPMVSGLPTLYYVFVLWYYAFYRLTVKFNKSQWARKHEGTLLWRVV